MKSPRWSLLLLAAFLTFPALAQENDETDEQTEQEIERITITADYEPLDPRTVSAQVSVIGQDEIRAASPRSAAEIVAPVLGVLVSRYGGITEPSTVSIRGSSAEQVLVLVNGKRLNSAQGGGVDLNTINPEFIERIEIIRGGSSAIYGESAFGGVINIVTKDGYGEQLGGSLSYGFASLNTHTLSAQIMGSFGPEDALDFFLSGSGLYTGGNYTYADPNAPGGMDTRSNTQGLKGDSLFKLGWNINGQRGLRLSLAGQTHNDSKGVPGLSEFPTPNATIEDQLYRGTVSFNFTDNPVAALSADLYLGKQIRDYSNPDDIEGEVEDRHDNTAGGLDLELKRSDRFGPLLLKTSGGYQLRFDRLVSTGLLQSAGTESAEGRVARNTHSASLRGEIHLFPGGEDGMGRLVLFPALRFDSHHLLFPDGNVDRLDRAFSYNVGAMIPLFERNRLILKGNVGFAYRLPSFDDLFWPATAFAVGNPELLPEEAFVYDAGILVQPFAFLSLEAVYFDHDISNLIQWNPGPSGQWRPINLASARIRGLETEAKLLFPLNFMSSYCELKGNYSFTKAENTTKQGATAGAQLPRQPYEKANLSGTLTHYDGHSFRVEGRFVGFRFTTAQNTKYLPAYFVLDAAVNLKIGERYQLTVSGRNLLNSEYVDIREFPVPGRELAVGLEVSF